MRFWINIYKFIAPIVTVSLCAGLAWTAPDSGIGTTTADTVTIMGGPDRQDGRFQNDANPDQPDAEGWLLPYQVDGPLWHVDTFNAALLDPAQPTNHAMWCGKYYPPCQDEEFNGGYGSSLDERLDWTGTVPDPLLSTTVRMTAVLNYDTEPAYDYLYLEVAGAVGYTSIQYYNGTNGIDGDFVPVDVDLSFTVDPADYQGDNGDEIHLRWRFTSDGAFNDQDCIWPTEGAAQIDNIAVSFDQGSGPAPQTFDDFEAGSPVNWTASVPVMCGFAQVWPRLEDAGFCRPANTTPQLAFIDDGTACDGVPSFGSVLDYGPDGLSVDCANIATINNQFWSPALPLPDMSLYESLVVECDAYLHQAGVEGPQATLSIRTSRDGGLTWNRWLGYNPYASDQPVSLRISEEFQRWVPSDADRIQIALGYTRLVTGANPDDCPDPSPAPYFDNVTVKAFRHAGPLSTRLRHDVPTLRAKDRFPQSGLIDPVNLATNNVAIDVEDILVALPRNDSVIHGLPELYWTLKPNPLFDAYRTNLPANPVTAVNLGSEPSAVGFPAFRYAFTLPDDGFLYPGDELHFYYRFQDDVAGDIGTATLPADTTGFGDFSAAVTGQPGLYPQRFRYRALPTLRAADPDSQPRILVWDRSDLAGETPGLMLSLAQLGYRPGRDYDLFRDNGGYASLSGFVTTAQLTGYATLIVVSDGEAALLSPPDVNRLAEWLALGDRNLLTFGGGVVSFDLAGLGIAEASVRPLIDDQALPEMVPTGIVPQIDVPLAADGCDFLPIGALSLLGTGQTLYEFAAPDGGPGGYPHPAAVYNLVPATGARVITFPTTFARLVTTTAQPGGLLARSVLLGQILEVFGHAATGEASAVPVRPRFSVRAYPNPFNPRTTIAFHLPRDTAVDLDIYDLAGRHVRTLLGGVPLPAGAHGMDWSGKDESDRQVAAGVYFYRLIAGADRAVQRITLIK